jgi:hypothetical protein
MLYRRFLQTLTTRHDTGRDSKFSGEKEEEVIREKDGELVVKTFLRLLGWL